MRDFCDSERIGEHVPSEFAANIYRLSEVMADSDAFHGAASYLERLRNNPDELRQELCSSSERLVGQLHVRYPFFPKDVIQEVIQQFQVPPLLGNPLAMRYIDSEFAVVDAQIELMCILENCGLGVRDRSVLDIGCSNGALLFACFQHGAARAVGVDVNDSRLAKARRLLGAQPFADRVTITRANLLEEDLSTTLGPFQVILSTNVLEHVPSVPQFFDAVRRHLSMDAGSFAMVSVGNKYNISNVLSEPHYGIPGLVLLNQGEAERLWQLERGKLGNDQPYEVYDWYLFEEYRTMALSNHLAAELLLDENALVSFDPGAFDAVGFAKQYGAMALDHLAALGLEGRSEGVLRSALDAYWEEFLQDHRTAGRSAVAKRDLFIKYHVYLLRMVLRHPLGGSRVGL